jgi:ATP-dependent RNA helicase RhlE
MSFKLLGLSATILKSVESAGYSTPTPIQAAAIPIVLAGRDIVGCAQTGTGKTAGFVLPMLDLMSDRRSNNRNRAPRALIVTPTRELAVQVEEAVRTYGRFSKLFSQTIYGGVSIDMQIKRLRRGVDIVVGTPGRLLDHINRGTLDLSAIEFVVVDEADRMFDMGFIKDIRTIIAETPQSRQTLLFSATMDTAVRKLADEILNQPESVTIGEVRNPAETVAQHVCGVTKERKLDLLLHVLDAETVDNVIVFSRTKHGADRITKRLGQKGHRAAVMHSNKTQSQRQRALDGFKTGRFNILVATDVAARGIDVDNISHVINFDTPNQPDAYIHRIGRTGRAEATGDAITFVSRDEERYLRDIERHTGRKLSNKAYDGFDGLQTILDDANGSSRRPKKSSNGKPRNGQKRSFKGNRNRSRASRPN